MEDVEIDASTQALADSCACPTVRLDNHQRTDIDMRNLETPRDPVGVTWAADAADLSSDRRERLTAIDPMTATALVGIATKLLDARDRIGRGLGTSPDLTFALDRSIAMILTALVTLASDVGSHETAAQECLLRRALPYAVECGALLLATRMLRDRRRPTDTEQVELEALRLERAIGRYARARRRATTASPLEGA